MGFSRSNGRWFAAVLLRTRCIWMLIVIHALLITSIVAVQALTTGEVQLTGPRPRENPEIDALISVLVTLPLAVYGLCLLRDPRLLEPGGILAPRLDRPRAVA